MLCGEVLLTAPTMYIDSHAHMFYEDFGSDLPEVLRRSREAGVRCIVVPGTTLETSRQAVELADRHAAIYACVGYHPHDAAAASERNLKEIEDLSAHPKVVAIGEIGLDYHYDHSPRDRQREVFRTQLEMAVRRDLPVVVHTRESMEEAMAEVTEVARSHPSWLPDAQEGEEVKGRRGVFHCFSGSAVQARELFRQGIFVSYPGIVTFKNSPVAATLRELGLRNILLETDSPYLSPVPLRGKRNEPANIPLIANKIAEILGAEPAAVAARTSANAQRLFSLPDFND